MGNITEEISKNLVVESQKKLKEIKNYKVLPTYDVPESRIIQYNPKQTLIFTRTLPEN
jgi:hypothetical protein